MTLYLIGIGLEEKDISLKSINAIKKCNYIYLDKYTSVGFNIKILEKLFNKKIVLTDRELLENKSKDIIERARKENVAILVYGDCLSATTHISLILECDKLKVKCEIIHGISVLTAVGEIGLSLYNFGKAASIPFENKDIKTSYEILKNNQKFGMHTLFLLDLNPKEKKFMTIKEGLEYLLNEEMDKNKLVIGCARLGRKDNFIKAGRAEDLMHVNFGKPPHCFIVPGKLHFIEEEFLKKFK